MSEKDLKGPASDPAKDSSPDTEKNPPPEKQITPLEPKHPRFRIDTPVVGFVGTRLGVNFSNGVGWTDDHDVAMAMVGFGYAVTDTQKTD